MQTAQFGNNHVTHCPCCDVLIVIKNKDARAGSDEVHAQLEAHIRGSRKCRAYYDALPTFKDMVAIFVPAVPPTGNEDAE